MVQRDEVCGWLWWQSGSKARGFSAEIREVQKVNKNCACSKRQAAYVTGRPGAVRHHRYSPESMLRTLSSKYTTPPIHTDLNHLVQIFPIRTILGDISPDFPTFHMRSHSQPCARSHSSHPQRNDQSATRGVSLLRQECRTSTCTLVLLHYPNPGTARLCPIGRMINIYKGACAGVYFSDGLHMKPEEKKVVCVRYYLPVHTSFPQTPIDQQSTG